MRKVRCLHLGDRPRVANLTDASLASQSTDVILQAPACHFRPEPVPGEGAILLRVAACGICRTDRNEVTHQVPLSDVGDSIRRCGHSSIGEEGMRCAHGSPKSRKLDDSLKDVASKKTLDLKLIDVAKILARSRRPKPLSDSLLKKIAEMFAKIRAFSHSGNRVLKIAQVSARHKLCALSR